MSAPAGADLSVIIPTLDRLERLEGTLAAIEAQELSGASAEIIVVDNGSRDGTVERLRRRSGRADLPVHVHEQPRPGASAARNVGIGAARHPIVLFLGDDTAPADTRLLQAHADLHAARPEPDYAVLGRIAWAPNLHPTPLMRWLERGPQFAYERLTTGPVSREHFYSSHVSLKTSALRECGGFDERLPFLFEDVELGARLADRGLTLDYRPDLVVHHDHPIRLEQWLTREHVAGRSGRIVNSIRPREPRLAPSPAGPGWLLQRALGVVLRPLPTEYARLPPRLRAAVYTVLSNAAYARGYRGA
ncbi:MAG: glycosyltransferase family 2 protein [Thermoleophilaceae bacterium]